MKKVFMIFGFVAALGITFTVNSIRQTNADKNRNSDNVKIEGSSLTENELKSIQNIIGEKNFQSDLNKKIFDLSKSSSEILKSSSSKEVVSAANNNLATLFDCYVKSKCGVSDSTINSLIGRHLELIKLAIKNENNTSKDVNWTVIRECEGIKNNNIKILASDLLFNYDSHNNGKTRMLDMVASYSGAEKVDFFKSVAETLNADEREVFISTLKNSFKNDDSKTVQLIVENLNNLKLSKVELANIQKDLCHLKAKDNWEKIKSAMSSISPDFEKSCL